jgi:hypothetical protein
VSGCPDDHHSPPNHSNNLNAAISGHLEAPVSGEVAIPAGGCGLLFTQTSERLMSLGHKCLLPKDALAELALIESRTHSIVEKGTFPFLGGIGHFLPNAKLVDVQEQLNSHNLRFRSAAEEFLRKYRDLRNDALDEWRDATRQIAKTNDEAERLFSQIQSSFPQQELLERRFTFDVHLFQIAVPEQLDTELLSFAEQNEVRLARQQAPQYVAREIRQGVESFVGECVIELRQQTAQLCSEMLTSMRSGKTGGVHQKTLNRLTSFIGQFKELNFADDQEMEQQLDRVRGELLSMSAEDYRQSPSATRSLEAGLGQLRDHAQQLATQDARDLVARFGQMGRRKLQLAG